MSSRFLPANRMRCNHAAHGTPPLALAGAQAQYVGAARAPAPSHARSTCGAAQDKGF